MKQQVTNSKRFLSILLTLCMTLAMLPAFSIPALAAADETVDITAVMTEAAIKADIQAAIDIVDGAGGGTVTVTGSKTDVTAGIDLDIPDGVKVIWRAEYIGELDSSFEPDNYLIKLNALPGFEGDFEVADGGVLSAQISNAPGLAIDVAVLGNVIVSGGTVSVEGDGSMAIIINTGIVKVTDGVVSAAGEDCGAIEVADGSIEVSGGEVSDDIDGGSGDCYALCIGTGSVLVKGGSVEAFDSTPGGGGHPWDIYINVDGTAAYAEGTCLGGNFGMGSSPSGWIAEVAAGWTGEEDAELSIVEQDGAYASIEWDADMYSLFITDDTSAYTLKWDETVYNVGDIAVIESMIDNNGLLYPEAPVGVDVITMETWMAANWSDVNWDVFYPEARIVGINFSGKSLSGSLDLTALDKLAILNIANNDLTSLDVSGCAALEELQCDGNYLTSLDVSGCVELVKINCENNDLTTLDASDCVALEELICSYNSLTTLDASDCIALEKLTCYDNSLTSLYVTGCVALESILCDINKLTSLDVSGLVALKELKCSASNLVSLELSGCAALETLECTDNKLTELDVADCVALITLKCYANKLTELDVTGCVALEELLCDFNSISSLDIDGLIALNRLNCDHNLLTELNLDGIAALTSLNCSYNLLDGLDVTDCVALEYLHCESNLLETLTGLPISLLNLYCSQNRLSGFDVAGLDDLTYLDCRYNYMEDEIATEESCVSGISGIAHFVSWGVGGFRLEPQHAEGFIAAIMVVDLPDTLLVGETLTLTGTVLPDDATNKDITVWGIDADLDGTGSTIDDDVLTAGGTPGRLEMSAVVENGAAVGENLVWTFFIDVEDYTDVTFTAAQTGGVSGKTDSAGIILTFDKAVTGLAASDITITNGTGSATKGALSGSGTTWTIALTSVTKEGNVTVEVANFENFNVTTAPQTAAVYKAAATSPSDPGVSGGGGGGGGGVVTTVSSLIGKFLDDVNKFILGSGENLIYTVQKDIALFKEVRVDNKLLKKDEDYGVESGSTVVTLYADYLETLSPGEHTLTVSFTDATTATATLTVESAEENQISVVPITPEMPINPFIDVLGTDWFIDAVIYVYDKGLMNGTSADPMLFSPNATLTRGMVVTVLYRMENTPDVSGMTNPFDDVAAGQWYADAVVWAADKEIVSGYGDGKFGPEDNITREQMAAILLNYELFTHIVPPDIRVDTDFADWDDISEYARNAVTQLTMQGIVTGKPNNLFDPKGNATRAEFATVLMRFLEAVY